jgi:hypothetical protein
MTVKINTWIETYKSDFNGINDTGGVGFALIKVKRFDYDGSSINTLKIKNEDKSKFESFIANFEQGSSHHRRRVEIVAERVKKLESWLEVEGNINIKEWQMPSEFRFKITGMDDARDGIFKFTIEEKELAENSLSPKVNQVEMPFNVSQLGDYDLYLNNGDHRDKEVTISDIEWEAHGGGENVTLNQGKLVIGSNAQRSVMPKIRVVDESKEYPHPDQKQSSSQEAVRNKISAAVERTRKATKRLFRWGFNNDSKEDFQEAVQAASELIKIAQNGSQEEKAEFKNYLAWQIDSSDLENEFKKLKDFIRDTSLKNGKGWKYDLDKGEINWGSTQTENNQGNKDKGNDEVIPQSGNDNSDSNNKGGNDKKRKNEGDDDSQKSKRTKVEEEVKQEQAKSDEENANKLANDLVNLNSKNAEERKQSLADIEKLKNQGGVYEKKKEEIEAKKDEAAKSDPQGYGRMIAEIIQKKIDEFKVEIAKLGNEIKEKLERLKNGNFSDDNEVRKIEEEVSDKVSKEVANVEVNDLLAQAQKLLNNKAGELKGQLEKIKKGLWSLKITDNPYQQKAYQLKKDEVEKALKGLENFQSQQPSSKGFFRPEVIIPLSLSIVVLAVVAAVVIRRRKLAKVKK